LYRCLLNLISNAVDACRKGGCVRVRLHRAEGKRRFTISVTGDGMGIARATQKKIFKEFFTTKGGRGTGLGLPVTKKLVTEMGGKIAFHGVQGAGTRFVLALPIDPRDD